jgi:hypothetical protein
MHPMTCTCPSCRAGGAGEFEFEFENENEYEFEYESFENEEVSEQEEVELAMELLSVQNEYEMEQFLGKLVKGIGRGLKKIGKVALPALKSLAKVALPIAGKALGSFIPIPGVGTMIGGAIGKAAANALEMELAGVDPAQADMEKARRFVRIARSTLRDASRAPDSAPPEAVVRNALTAAVQRTIPGVNLSAARAGTRMGPAIRAFGPQAATGRWYRRGNTLVVVGG